VTYIVTAEGRAAATGAMQARERTNKVLRDVQAPGTYASRVYGLLRARRVLAAPDAAATLIDAGEDVKAATERAAQLLRTWSQMFPHALQASAKRIDGATRYVLLKELGEVPPPRASQIRTNRARGGAPA
jgi:hypothetical protein